MVAPRPAKFTSTISDITRKAIADWFALSDTRWNGGIGESRFLGRVFNLTKLPSNDNRCSDMADDVAFHRENWLDWGGPEWVFDDARLNLLHGPDENFLAFLCESVHPRVRSDVAESKKIVDALNEHLLPDGWQLVDSSRISGRPVYAAHRADRPAFFEEPIGWVKVDRQMSKAKLALAAGVSEEDFQGVGLLCREALISVAQEVHDPAKHPCLESDVKMSTTDAKRMLEAYISVEMAGGPAEEARGLVRAALKMALNLHHKREADFRTAALCAHGTHAVIEMVAITTGRRDKTPRAPEPVQVLTAVPSPVDEYSKFDNDIPF